MVTSANDDTTYHLVDLDGTRMTTSVVGKRIKVFKIRNEAEPEPTMRIESNDSDQEDE